MKREYINLLNLREYYIIYSSLTKEVFVNENGSCFLCMTEEKANELVSGIKDAYIKDKAFLTMAVFCDTFYSCGVNTIHVFDEKGLETIIPLVKEDVSHGYYNVRTSFLASQLLLTGKKECLRELVHRPIIIPVIIKERQERQYPVMNYVCAITKKGTRYSVAFTTLTKFEEWNKDQGCKYSPLETTLLKYTSILKKKPVIVDPRYKSLILTSKQINGARHK